MNTTTIRALVDQLDAARKQIATEKELLAVMELKAGQNCSASVSFCGKKFSLAYMNSGYMPSAVKQLDTVRLALIEYQKACISQQAGAIEGLEWKIKQAVKGGAS